MFLMSMVIDFINQICMDATYNALISQICFWIKIDHHCWEYQWHHYLHSGSVPSISCCRSFFPYSTIILERLLSIQKTLSPSTVPAVGFLGINPLLVIHFHLFYANFHITVFSLIPIFIFIIFFLNNDRQIRINAHKVFLIEMVGFLSREW